jgi:hypothetical protein
MFRFFRQLRQRLLEEQKLSKYLLYASGEILLVVIGILLALQINTWNEGRKNDEYQRELLNEIRLSLQKDINHNTNIALRWIDRFLAHGDTVLMLYGAPNSRMDTVNKHLSLMLRSPDFAYNTGAYQTLKSNGLERITNKKLREEIITFYDFQLPRIDRFIVEITRGNTERTLALIDKLYIQRKVVEPDGTAVLIQEGKEGILQDPDLLRLISVKRLVGQNAKNRINSILKEMEGLKAAISHELNP